MGEQGHCSVTADGNKILIIIIQAAKDLIYQAVNILWPKL